MMETFLEEDSTFLKFVVTGTGRCGTVYMARVLTSVGVPCGHESVFSQVSPPTVRKRIRGEMKPTISKCSDNQGWLDLRTIVADSSYMAVPFLKMHELRETPIIHVVRNPLAVISSFVQDLKYFQGLQENPYNKRGWEQWIWNHCPVLNSVSDPIERACAYVFNWNERIEKLGENRPYYFHRAEDEFNEDFFAFLNVSPQSTFKNKTANTMRVRENDFTKDDIPAGKVKDRFLSMIDRYDY